MRILLTGAGGQLGQDLQAVLRDEVVDARDHGALDISDEAAVLATVRETGPQWVINAAAYNDVDRAEIAEDEAFAVNARGPANLAAAAVNAGLVHISTDYVFDGRKGEAYTEADPPHPLSVYGRSKYEGERSVLESKASVYVLRTAWLFGVHGKNFVKAILEKAKEGRPLDVVADQVGSPTSTRDLAEAINRLIRTQAHGLFHVANAGACSRFEFAKAIVRGAVEVRPITSAQASRPAPRPANSSLASIRWPSLGLPPLRPWQAALDDFLDAIAV